jgi:2,4-dienoyl-CoA reductase-like NADH-dependent reductase (Old Yellow Enzyme family)
MPIKKLFEKTKINQVVLKNRFVRSATWEGLANPDGSCNKRISEMMVDLARGEVGLIISSHSYVNPIGQAGNGQLGIYDDNLIDSYQKMVKKVHEEGSKIIMQISHAGGRAISRSNRKRPIGPSPLEIKGYSCREMAIHEIEQTVNDFTAAAVRAKKAGFDGIQIHGAHGFLLNQFLSPFFNKRSDNYGGKIENRARIILEILNSIRNVSGNKFAIIIKLNSDDFLDGGFTPEEMVEVSLLLEKAGIDAIELSGGSSISKYSSSRIGRIDRPEEEVYYRDAAKLYKESLKVPLILVGGIRSFQVAQELIEQNLADYIALCRPLIREPQLIKRWHSGDIKKATCIYCNQCFIPARAGEGLYCVQEALLNKKKK